MKEILVLGSNFAGATAAIQLSRKLKKEDVNLLNTNLFQFLYHYQ